MATIIWEEYFEKKIYGVKVAVSVRLIHSEGVFTLDISILILGKKIHYTFDIDRNITQEFEYKGYKGKGEISNWDTDSKKIKFTLKVYIQILDSWMLILEREIEAPLTNRDLISKNNAEFFKYIEDTKNIKISKERNVEFIVDTKNIKISKEIIVQFKAWHKNGNQGDDCTLDWWEGGFGMFGKDLLHMEVITNNSWMESHFTLNDRYTRFEIDTDNDEVRWAVKVNNNSGQNLWDIVWNPDNNVQHYYRHTTGLMYINHEEMINRDGNVTYRVIADALGKVGEIP